METTFISIHDLSRDAKIKYVSDSVEDILGYAPQEVVNKSCWEYFHPDEIPFAQAIHGRGVQLERAAVLNYCQIKHKDGHWVGCECVFTIVYNVMVSCTSIYSRGPNSEKRALDAPIIRRIFSSSPRDPRYHMLSYLSKKFSQEPKNSTREPRAALFLNRFARHLPIMFATNGLDNILGVSAAQLIERSFYHCIAENCLPEAIRCMESAKGNDSIAYLRFWFRNPLQDDARAEIDAMDQDGRSSDEDEDEGGVQLQSDDAQSEDDEVMRHSPVPGDGDGQDAGQDNAAATQQAPRTLSDDNTIGVRPQPQRGQNQQQEPAAPIEIEAVVSATSDGMVVILRRALPFAPDAIEPTAPPAYSRGFFATPWALDPINAPPVPPQPQYANDFNFAQAVAAPAPLQARVPPPPPPTATQGLDFMNTIREVAVFAWGLVGINGSLEQFSRGSPSGESLPPGGMPIWDPSTTNQDPDNIYNGFMDNSNRRIHTATTTATATMTSTSTGTNGSSGLASGVFSGSGTGTASDQDQDREHPIWRRAPTMPAWHPVDRQWSQQSQTGSSDEEEHVLRMRLSGDRDSSS